MRKKGRVDSNQSDIVMVLRKIGATVAVLSAIGNGFPDLLVGYKYGNYLMELKDPALPVNDTLLTDDEKKFHKAWKGQVNVVRTVQDAFDVIGFKGVIL